VPISVEAGFPSSVWVTKPSISGARVARQYRPVIAEEAIAPSSPIARKRASASAVCRSTSGSFAGLSRIES